MRESDIRELLEGIGDPAFVVDLDGLIRYVNAAAVQVFAKNESELLGASCFQVFQIQDASGEPVCQESCVLRQRALAGKPMPAFDAEVLTNSGRRWVNVTTAIIRSSDGVPLVVHVARDVQLRKQIEQITRHFLMQLGALSGDTIENLLSSGPVPHYELSQQERVVLGRLVQGQGTKDIATGLHISESTARNHVEHILHKLAAHTRVEAVLRAIREKLV